jgi:hypothetical protein
MHLSKATPNNIKLKSFTGDDWYNIDPEARTCNCPAFEKGRCEHLDALGIHPVRHFTPSTHPTFSQALSGLVKSIRIRRVEEAIYWLVYLDTFPEAQYRFRTARRLLIGSAEDGMSIPVMENCSQNFPRLKKRSTDLLYLVAEAVRICRLPNWWHPESGGADYIYSSLVGQRRYFYKQWDHKLSTLLRDITEAIEQKDKQMALGGLMAFGDLKGAEHFGATKQAQFLLEQAERQGNELAARLCEIHLANKSALSDDNNFTGHAIWLLSGGVSPLAEKIEPVTEGECHQLLENAKEAWKTPHPIPTWGVDGIHSAGRDSRFAGCLPEMVAVCNAFEHYGRCSPEDVWLPQFQCWDGLIIQEANTPPAAGIALNCRRQIP